MGNRCLLPLPCLALQSHPTPPDMTQLPSFPSLLSFFAVSLPFPLYFSLETVFPCCIFLCFHSLLRVAGGMGERSWDGCTLLTDGAAGQRHLSQGRALAPGDPCRWWGGGAVGEGDAHLGRGCWPRRLRTDPAADSASHGPLF